MTQPIVFNDVEAARFLGLAVQSMRNLRCKMAGPPYVKMGRRIVYLVADLQAYLDKHRIDPADREEG